MAVNVMNIEPNVPKALLEDYVILCYGRAKAGKTSLFYKLAKEKFNGDLSKALLCGFEKGYKALRGLHAVDVNLWQDFLDLVDQLVENFDDVSYRWIGVDTLDIMYQQASEYVVRKERIARKDAKIKALADVPWGAGYSLVDEQLQGALGKLINAGFGLFLITHDTDKKFESRNGQSYDKTTVSLAKRARDTFVNMADFIVFIDIEKEKEGKELKDSRYIYFRSDNDIEAGSRFENVPEKIEYSAEGFLEVFENAVLGAFDGDDVAVEDAREKQSEEREEKSKGFREEKKAESTTETLIAEMNSLVEKLDKAQQAELKKQLKVECGGTVNYKKYETVEQLTKAVEIANSLIEG
jgi:hypothetical protein